jgi:crotonobetainyl-CoA:carnitine CoA-transferase CaiB-like acyl-CoA transferase
LPQVEHPVLGPLTHPGIVPKLSSTPGEIMHSGPNLGENTRDVLMAELDYSASEIDQLIAKKIVFCS